ncbi:MAG: ABC transporter ATP-binding protein [Desulfobacterales bacterium]|nr:ABC transporter ATP-binding protein [Desulfobacterales bacterium]
MSKKCFEFEKVSFSWPGGPAVLDSQDFSLPGGMFSLVRGPSGSGKSSLLRLMNRLETPQKGTVRYLGRSLEDWDPPKLRQQVTYLQQMPVIPDLSVRDTLLFPFKFNINSELTPPSDASLLARLDRVQLSGVGLGDSAAALSGGQRQRLSLLRALVTEPDVLLLDEPTASLDRESKAVVEEMVEELCGHGATVVMITHDGYIPKQAPVAEVRIKEGRVEVCL